MQARPSGFSKFVGAADAEAGKGAFGNVQMGSQEGGGSCAANGDSNSYTFSNGAVANSNGYISNSLNHR